jgi:hypothetical protein
MSKEINFKVTVEDFLDEFTVSDSYSTSIYDRLEAISDIKIQPFSDEQILKALEKYSYKIRLEIRNVQLAALWQLVLDAIPESKGQEVSDWFSGEYGYFEVE